MWLVLGATLMEVSLGGVDEIVRVASALTAPSVAVTRVTPSVSGEATPWLLITATDGAEEDHTTLDESTAVEPSE